MVKYCELVFNVTSGRSRQRWKRLGLWAHSCLDFVFWWVFECYEECLCRYQDPEELWHRLHLGAGNDTLGDFAEHLGVSPGDGRVQAVAKRGRFIQLTVWFDREGR